MTDSQIEQSSIDSQPVSPQAARKHRAGRLIGCLLIVVAVGGAAALARHWMLNKPQAERKHPNKGATLVTAEPIALRNERVTVRVLGTVGAARSIGLAPRVAGRIIRVSADFVPGAHLEVGDELLRLDPEDYELAVDRRQAEADRAASDCTRLRSEITRLQTNITQADCALKIEMGQQVLAKEAYERLGETVKPEDEELVLRKPELRIAQANCEAARAAKAAAEASLKAAVASANVAKLAHKQAELDLERTIVRAPVNVVIAEKLVDVGSQVSSATPVARLVGTDEYWVEVSVPVDQLKWLEVPGATDTARIYYDAAWGADAFRAGRVFRLATNLEPQGRMARLLISVRDPLSLTPQNAEQPALILGAYVRVEIEAAELADVARIPRSALHDGDKVWIKTPKGKLDIRSVTVSWSDDEHVYIKADLRDGELLVTSDLGTPVQGMAVRTADEKPAPKPDSNQGGKPGGLQ
jgi:biotin carboxyl carrier protein